MRTIVTLLLILAGATVALLYTAPGLALYIPFKR